MSQLVNEKYFYNAIIRKTVAVFGSLFNNIYTGKEIASNLTNLARVPISYGPREHFLVRIRNADNVSNTDIAVKLPRMSFEITSLSFDSSSKLNKLNQVSYPNISNDSRYVIKQSTPYSLGFSLNILSRDQDTALQIIEQIIPNFNPEYTITVNDFEGPGSKTDLPIVLNGITMQDDYEGDFETSRRTILYTLDFTIKIKFGGDPKITRKIIKSITVNLKDCVVTDPMDQVNIELGDPENDTPENYTVITTYGFDN